MLQGSVGQRTSSKLASARGLQGMKGLQGKGSAKGFAEALTPQLGARTPSRAPWQEAENMGASFQAFGPWAMSIVYVARWGGWRQGCLSRCTGGAPEGLYTSILPRLLPLSHPVGVNADVYLQFLTTVVMGGNGLSRLGGNLGLRV